MSLDSPDLPHRYFKKAIRKDIVKITLDAEMIRLLMAIDENKNISQVARAVDMNLTKVREILGKLLEMELVVPVMKEIRYLDQAFMGFLKTKLKEAVGPMGDIIIEDILEEMNLDANRVPMGSAADFVTKIAGEIPRGENRTRFENEVSTRIPKA